MRIEKGRMTIEDSMDKLVETKEGITCGCENPIFKITMHMDGKGFYSTQYDCACGNHIVVHAKRTDEEMMRWGD